MLRAFEIGGAPDPRQQPARVADPAEPPAEPLRAGASRRSGSTSWSERLGSAGVSTARDRARQPSRARAETEQAREAAKRTYSQGVAVTKDVITSVRMGRATSVKRVKRAVQLIVDQVLNNETSLVGLTTIRDYDEYTFTHSVNVCIFSVALGKKLGFTRLQLYDLGHGGAAARHGQGAGAGRDPQQDDRPGRAGVARHAGAPVARRADAVRAARVRRDALPGDPRRARAPHEDRPDRVSPDRPARGSWASSPGSWRWPTASTPRLPAGATRRCRSSRTRCCGRCGRTPSAATTRSWSRRSSTSSASTPWAPASSSTPSRSAIVAAPNPEGQQLNRPLVRDRGRRRTAGPCRRRGTW